MEYMSQQEILAVASSVGTIKAANADTPEELRITWRRKSYFVEIPEHLHENITIGLAVMKSYTGKKPVPYAKAFRAWARGIRTIKTRSDGENAVLTLYDGYSKYTIYTAHQMGVILTACVQSLDDYIVDQNLKMARYVATPTENTILERENGIFL